jgi:hypothetical protein
MKCVCPTAALLAEAFDARAKRLINRRLSDNLSDEKDLELWARQQTWQHASMMVHALLEGSPVNEH